MKTILLIGFIAYVNANVPLELQELVSRKYVHLGPYDAQVKIGNLSSRYSILDNDDLTASRNARQFLEEARALFKYGFYTLPPLDPYKRDYLPTFIIDDDLKDLKGVIQLSGYNMTGLVKFVQNLIEIRLKTGRLDYALNVPLLLINVDVNGHVVVWDRIPIHLQGQLSLALQGVSILGAVQMQPTKLDGQLVLQVAGQHTRLHINDVGLEFRGTRFDIVRDYDSVTGGLGYHSQTLGGKFDNLKSHIDNYIANLVLKEANQILNGPTLDQILAYLLPDV